MNSSVRNVENTNRLKDLVKVANELGLSAQEMVELLSGELKELNKIKVLISKPGEHENSLVKLGLILLAVPGGPFVDVPGLAFILLGRMHRKSIRLFDLPDHLKKLIRELIDAKITIAENAQRLTEIEF